MKKLSFIIAVIAALVIAGCASSGGSSSGSSSEPAVDIGNEWTLDFGRIVDASWSDGDKNSNNPPAEVAEAVENPNGGMDFTFTMNNQRIIFGLSRAQIQKVRAASNVEIIIDGESSGSNKFRYHIGDSEVGSDWNASESFDASEFSSLLNRTVKIDKSRPSTVKCFMIQSRGATTGAAFTPETVTIRSITFICK